MSRGINKTAKSARTRITRELVAKTNMKYNVIFAAVYFPRRYQATYRRWHAHMLISGRGISLLHLKARQTKKGVTYVDPDGGARTLLPHAFIQSMPRGGRGVFLRLTEDRLPIEKQYGPSLSQIYKDAPAVAGRIQKETGRDLTKNIMTQIRVLLEQKARRV